MTRILTPPTTYAFFQHLRLPEERGFLEFRALPSKKQSWQEWPPPENFDGLYEFHHEEIYFGVLLRDTRKGNATHVRQGSVAWLELDLAGSLYLPDWDKKSVKQAPPEILRRSAEQLWADLEPEARELGLPPLAAVYSGQGLHVYWGLTTPQEGKWLEGLNKSLIKLFRSYNPEESAYDRARILRVPGTCHSKNPQRPLPVELLYLGDERLPRERLEAILQVEDPPALPPSLERATRAGLSPWEPSEHDLRLLVEHWHVGERNQKAMAFGGWCASHGVPEKVALDLVERICREAGDEEPANRRSAVANSYRRYQQGLSILGFSSLRKMVPGLGGKGRVSLGVLSASESEALEGAVPGESLSLPPEYRLDEAGRLVKVEVRSTRWGIVEDIELLAPRPIGVREVYTDLATGEKYLRLFWPDLDGTVVERLVPMGEAMTRQGLLRLAAQGLPVDEPNAAQLSRFLQMYLSHNRWALPHRRVTSHLGWQGETFILPGGEVEVLEVDPEPWRPRGNLEGWLEGLRALLSWGVTPALIAAALSATAPLVRAARLVKNPILALSTTSHSGKTTAVYFALSIWGSPEYNETLYLEDATVNGLMGRMMARQNLPLGLDDLQRYDDRKVGELVHLLSGGAEKARLKRDGSERLARRWRGVALLTGEVSALRETLGSGAVNRMVEMDDYPLGVGKGPEGAERSRILREAAQHWGQARTPLLELYADLNVREVIDVLGRLALETDAPADMTDLCGLVGLGVQILQVLGGWEGESQDEAAVVYLARSLVELRERHGSLAGRAMEALRDFLRSYAGAGDQPTDEIRVREELQAFYKGGVWFINPNGQEVERVMRRYGGLEVHLPEWARAGWIEVEQVGGRRQYKPLVRYKGERYRWVAVPLSDEGGQADER